MLELVLYVNHRERNDLTKRIPLDLLQVSQEEADQVHKMLEEFRDEVNEEKVLRRLNKKGAASEGWV